ncbi:hypothetical protein [Methylobacterium marchantiae]|uniref:hypothetical protein n=1 Tax=Methylobacterium marchantiae TaxID=600331 RepID=UPI00366E05B7
MPYATLVVDMKLDRRNPNRGLALWLMAVIVSIAGFCMSSPASAHSGHRHDGGAHVVGVQASISLDAKAVRGADIARSGMRMTMFVLRAEHHSGCSGPCCTASCGAACCCAIGLAPTEGDAATARGLTDPVPAGPISARTDVAPDSPSEPPRPFA